MKKSIFGYGAEDLPDRGRLTVKRDLAAHENWVEAVMPGDGTAGTLATEINRRPLYIFGIVVIALVVILGLRLVSLQIINGDHNLALADGNRIRQKVIRAPRGVIYDRNKQLLVRNVASFDVVVVPQLLPREAVDRKAEYDRLGAVIGVSAAEIESKTTSKTLSPILPRLVASNLDRDKALVLDQISNDFPGFSLDVNPSREYQDNGQLAQVLGYTGRVSADDLKAKPDYQPTDYIGKLGLEREYEDVLKGISGSQQTEVDALGRPIKVLANKSSVPGQNLILSIDKDLQNALTVALTKSLPGSLDGRAAAVAMNPKTGEILASVSLPGYDDNQFAKGISTDAYNKLVNDKGQPLFNKAIDGAYPTGSIIKPLIGSAGLEEKVINASTTVDDVGYIDVPNKYDPKSTPQRFRSYEEGGLGVVNIISALMKSSNVFFFSVGGGHGSIAGLGVDKLTSYYKKFGLGGKTGVDLPSETAGLVPTPALKKKNTGDDWRLGDTYNISVGQGDLMASPLQMAVAIGSIANGGKVMEPHFVQKIVDDQGNTLTSLDPKIVRQNFISQANLSLIQQGMRAVVANPSGTACCLIEQQVPVHVAAKTGTAETGIIDHANAWFAAYAPYEDPQIVIVAFVEKAGEGARWAAPPVRETLTWYFNRQLGK